MDDCRLYSLNMQKVASEALNGKDGTAKTYLVIADADQMSTQNSKFTFMVGHMGRLSHKGTDF